MTTYPAEEVSAALAAYVALRDQIAAGQATWTDLAELFTEDAVYIDPAWGRLQGKENLLEFFDESMRGLEGWEFPIEFTAISGNTVVIKWTQQLPTRRTDGSRYEQSGISTLVYAGDGKFCYEEDMLNMAHVIEDLTASGWRPGEGFLSPPKNPDRNFARP